MDPQQRKLNKLTSSEPQKAPDLAASFSTNKEMGIRVMTQYTTKS